MSLTLHIALYLIAAFQVFGALFVIGKVGKPRKPTTHSDAVVVVVVSAAIVVALILAAGQIR